MIYSERMSDVTVMKDNFDERQLYLRGNAFKHGFIFMSILLFLSAFIKSVILNDNSASLVEGMWGNILIIMLSAAICEIELILRDAIDFENQLNGFVIYLLGILGFILIIWGGIDLIISKGSIIMDYTLTEDGARLIINLAWVIVGLIYVIMKRRTKYTE